MAAPWCQTKMQGHIFCDVFCFVSDPEGVAAALEKAQQKNPHMCSLHNAHSLGVSVGDNIVPGYSGATVNDNPYYHLIPWSERRGLR